MSGHLLPLTNSVDRQRAEAHLCLWCGQPARPRSRYCSRPCKDRWNCAQPSVAERRRRTNDRRREKRRAVKAGCAVVALTRSSHNYDTWSNTKRLAANNTEARRVLLQAATAVLDAPLKNPAEMCQLCGVLRATDGAFCHGCYDDLASENLLAR